LFVELLHVDPLFQEDRPHYYEWIMDVFEATRFFSALAVIDKKSYDGIISSLLATKNHQMTELARNWEDFIRYDGYILHIAIQIGVNMGSQKLALITTMNSHQFTHIQTC
jgi:hypothetical protein